MMKNDGISLVTLIVSVVLLMILAGVSINVSDSTIKSVRDNNLEAEMGMVRQTVTQQYMKAVAVGQTEVSKDAEQVQYWVGTRITDFSTISLPPRAQITANDEFYDKESTYNPVYQEDFYYRLTPSDLYSVGVGDAEDTYIVNYLTCEVYNETRKINSKIELLYMPAITQKTEEPKVDETFSDWNK